MRPPYSSGVQRLLRNAQRAAGRYNHRFVHTEYLLLALLKDDNGATQLLREMKHDLNGLRRKCESKCHRGEHPMEEPLKLTTGVQHVFALAHEQMRELGDKSVDTRHVLLGLLMEEEGVGGGVLRHEKITPDAILAAIQSQGVAEQPKHEHEPSARPALWKRLLGGR